MIESSAVSLALKIGLFCTIVAAIVSLVMYWRSVARLIGIVVVPEDTVGLVNKAFVLFGEHKVLPGGSIIALHGEPGWQADTLGPGLYFGYWFWQYRVDVVPLVKIGETAIGVVEARDGSPIPPGRILARHTTCDAYQNARAFLSSGGQRGVQLTTIPPGTYRINTALFRVTEQPVLEISSDTVGIVTTREGAALDTDNGEIAGPTVAGHDAFQNAEAFVRGGGKKGLQNQVLLAGRYFINPAFASVSPAPMVTVPMAHVGVVVSYVGEDGVDVSGDEFRHGNIVPKGKRGVWDTPLDPGKYAMNPLTTKVEMVPTANIVLNWADAKTESHKLDKDLCTITARSSDGFTFNLDVSQIIHIPRIAAARVIARFGNIQNLVTQVLEPTIGNYFRNSAQASDVIAFLRDRQSRQAAARAQIGEVLTQYDVVGVDTLIGDITPPAELMKTLTDKKVAEQQQETFATMRLAQDARKEFEQAQAMANTQKTVVDAERAVSVAEFKAKEDALKASGHANAMIEEARGSAAKTVAVANADATSIRVTGQAKAEAELAVGSAEAQVIKMKIETINPDNYTRIQVAESLAQSAQPLVPTIVSGGETKDGGSFTNVLLAQLVSKQQQ